MIDYYSTRKRNLEKDENKWARNRIGSVRVGVNKTEFRTDKKLVRVNERIRVKGVGKRKVESVLSLDKRDDQF